MPIDPHLLAYLLPEIALIVFAVCVFVGGTFIRSKVLWTGLSAAVLVAAWWLVGRQGSPEWMEGPFLGDRLAQGFRLYTAAFGLLFLMILTQSRQARWFPELLGSLILLLAGLMVVSAAGDLIVLFLGYELISIPTYVLLFMGRSNRQSDEAAAKYFFLSILSSVFLLYGFATLYGISGHIEFAAIQANLQDSPSLTTRTLLPVALCMTLAGLTFKIAAVPFHFYAPDVYQATSNLNAAVLAVVPKMAGVVGLIRILVVAFPRDSALVWQIVVVLAIATMSLGNFAALWQQNLRRMMAYSSIANAGYLLIGVGAGLASEMGSRMAEDAVAAMLFFVVAYSLATIGVFAAIAYLSDDDSSFSQVDDLAGVGRSYPVIAACLGVCLFSLAGIPPLIGFWGKLGLFRNALDVGLSTSGSMQTWFLALCVVGVMNAAVAAAYYLRVVASIYLNPAKDDHSIMPVMGNPGPGLAALASVLLVVGAGLFAGSPMASAYTAARGAWYVSQRDLSEPSKPANRSVQAVARQQRR